LSAELVAETSRIAHTVAELAAAREILAQGEPDRLLVYGAAALLDTFYTGVEKALLRVASTMGDVPQGPSWHRVLLESMALDIAHVRPPVLSAGGVSSLEPLLSFRHRFRNLYLFDLRSDVIAELIDSVADVWQTVGSDLRSFIARLDAIASNLEQRSRD
jgi:hypothetical protein